MNTYHLTPGKEVTALDADVPLVRPSMIRFNVSDLRLQQDSIDRFHARHILVLRAD